jgi:hypothetical protein
MLIVVEQCEQFMKKPEMREVMPETAKFIDAVRTAFGNAEVNTRIRRAMAGEAGNMHAMENGVRFGVPDLSSKWAVLTSRTGRSYAIEADWVHTARCIATAKGIALPQLVQPAGHSEADWHEANQANIRTTDQARAIYLAATDEEIFTATMIKRDDYQ